MAWKPSSGVKDFLVLVGVFVAVLGGLYLYTQVWPPAVIVESGSMMHRDSEVGYGRLGTIDPGDLVLVKDVDDRSDVHTWADGQSSHYSMAGDVVIYFPRNQRQLTPIIHRAMMWIDVERENGEVRYIVHWNAEKACPSKATPGPDNTCVFGADGVTVEEINLASYRPFRSGLVTKGDNPVTNPRSDQTSGLSDIVQVEWIEGKARAEVPWLGLIKLSLSPSFNEPNCVTGERTFKFFEESRVCRGWVAFGHAYAPKDLWVMLGIALFVLVGIPLIYDVYKHFAEKRAPPPGLAQSEGAPPSSELSTPPPATSDTPPPPPPT